MTDHNASESNEVLTFGCRLNTLESEVMKAKAEEAGLTNTVLINTCAVTAEAVRQAKQSIRRARRENPNKRIIVTGCAAQTESETFANMAEVDAVIGNSEKLSAISYAPSALPDFGVSASEKIIVNDIMSVKETATHLIDGLSDRARAFVQVQNGCDHRCTFCIIPYGRGNSRSVPMGAVIEQIKHLRARGYNEVVITGVDITSYGADLPGTPSLGILLQTILEEVPDLPRLRLSSIDSIEVDEPLMHIIAHEKRFMPHLHLSLQAGDNMVLKRMKRRHLREDTIAFCKEVRKVRPEAIFGADIIAGFPTETEEMFQNSLKIVDECDLTYLHVFPYSQREGTPAVKMPQVNGKDIKSRAARLRAKGESALKTRLNREHGKTHAILVEKILPDGRRIGRTPHFMLTKLDKGEPGDIIEATIIDVTDKDLIAKATLKEQK